VAVEFQPVRIETGSPDEDGRLAFARGKLVALLVRIADVDDEACCGWSIEWLPEPGTHHPAAFADLQATQDWLDTKFDDGTRPARS
jgi:hypothetical protein